MIPGIRVGLFALISVTLSACCPNGCFIVTGDAYERLANPTPYLFKWKKDGATDEDRFLASAACGGGRSSYSPLFAPSELVAMQRPDETANQAYSRRFHDFERCLIRQGYRYTGVCYDNEIARNSPACGAP